MQDGALRASPPKDADGHVPRPRAVSADDVDVDGLVGHRGDKVVLGARHTGVGARERLARANRVERALVHRSAVDPAHEDLEALRLQLADRVIDGRWARRCGRSGSGQSKRGGRQRARCEGSEEDVLHCTFPVIM